jgi:mannosyltransferase
MMRMDEKMDGMMTLKIKEKGHIIVLILLIIGGFCLRFYHLDYNSLWYDESFTFFAASHSLSGIWDIASNNAGDLASVVLAGEFNPPLFYSIEHCMLVFGESEFVLRFIPLLFGVLTIPVFYYIGKEFANKDVGIVMAALLTVSPFHVFYSQEARAYTTMLFFFSLAFFFFLLTLRTNSMQSWILWGFFSALTLWTHYYTLIPLALLGFYAFFWGLSQGRDTVKQLYLYALALCTFILVCLPLVPLLMNAHPARTAIPPTLGVKGLLVAKQIVFSLSEYQLFLEGLFCVLFVIGIIFIGKNDKAKALLLVGLLGIPVLISIYLAETVPMDIRYLFYLLPFFFLGISLSFVYLAELCKFRNAFIILVVIFFLIQAPFLAVYYNTYFTTYSKEDWRGIAHAIEQTSTRGDIIFVIPYYTKLPLDIYYNNGSYGTYEFGVRNESEILPLLAGLKTNQAHFVVTSHINAVDPDGSTLQWLHNNTHRTGTARSIELYSLNVSAG